MWKGQQQHHAANGGRGQAEVGLKCHTKRSDLHLRGRFKERRHRWSAPIKEALSMPWLATLLTPFG